MRERVTQMMTHPWGRAMFRVAQPPVHLLRRLAHPDLPLDRAVTKVVYKGRKFTFLHRRHSNDDRLAIQQCFADGQYELPGGAHGVFLERVYRQIVASGRKPLIVDCGANIGSSVAWFSARFPEAHIVAVEPAPDNLELLKINCAGMDLDLWEAGVSAEDGQSFLSEPDLGGEMGYHVDQNGAGRPIRMISLATLLAAKPAEQFGPFLLKVDIEGSEKSLFEGDRGALNSFPLIIMEPHDWMFPGQIVSQSFFRFHVDTGREFCLRHENVISIAPGAAEVH